jgi:hypothetical protein
LSALLQKVERESESFNKALLAKQCWRLLQNLESLVAQMIKVKYFPFGYILNAKLGNKPSYVWRNFWKTRNLLNKGLLWRVGNGKNIKIWKERWLPNPMAFLVHSPSRGISDDVVVVEIIDKDARCWNVSLIKEVFPKNEVVEICQIPISNFNGTDQQIWRCTGNEDFTVKIAYHLDMNLVTNNIGECCYANRQSPVEFGR